MHFYGAYKQDVLYHMELVLFSLGQSLPLLNTRSLKYMIMVHSKTLQHRSTCSRFLHYFTDNLWRKRKWLIMKLSLKIPEIYFLQCGVFLSLQEGQGLWQKYICRLVLKNKLKKINSEMWMYLFRNLLSFPGQSRPFTVSTRRELNRQFVYGWIKILWL